MTGALDLESLGPIGAEDLYALVGQVLEDSSDPVERVSALVLLQSMVDARPQVLPYGAYRDLATKSVVETQLLLRRNAHVAIPYPDIVEEAAHLASAPDVDTRIQEVAIGALGHPETSDVLADVIESLARIHPPEWDGWFNSVAPALGRCGSACAGPAGDALAAAADSTRVASVILEMTSIRERADLIDHFRSVLPADFIARAERELE